MIVYNIEKDIIENVKVFVKDDTTYVLDRLTEEKLNEIGFLLVDDSNFEVGDYFTYYTKVLSVYGNKCIVKYYKHDRTIDEVKSDLLAIAGDPLLSPTIEEAYNKINSVNNCTTIDELKVVATNILGV